MAAWRVLVANDCLKSGHDCLKSGPGCLTSGPDCLTSGPEGLTSGPDCLTETHLEVKGVEDGEDGGDAWSP